jgi:hypothetical protein
MTKEQQKEFLGMSVLRAIAAAVGCSIDTHEIDDASIDFTIKSYRADANFRTARIGVQLKSTAVPRIRENFIHFPLEIKNYDDLRSPATNLQLLVVFVMPEDQSEWVEIDTKACSVKHCAYWVNLSGQKSKSNKKSVTVKIPTSNLVTPNVIAGMIESTHEGVNAQ